MTVEDLLETKPYVKSDGTFELAFIVLWLQLLDVLKDHENRIETLEP